MKSRAETRRQKVLADLAESDAARRRALEPGERRKLPSYTEEDLEETTSRYVALTAEAAARAVAEALADRDSVPGSDRESRVSKLEIPDVHLSEAHHGVGAIQKLENVGKIVAAIGALVSGGAAFVHWILGWF